MPEEAALLTLHQLEVLVAVVAEGSFSAAARRLGLTQPAVSLQVRGLEEHFGRTLLERSGRAVRLTDAGQQAHAYALRLLSLLSDMESAIRSEDQAPAGRLHVGSSTTPGECLLPLLLAAFRARYPQVQLTVEVSDTLAVLDRLVKHQCDVGLVGGIGHAERLDFFPFAADDLVLVAPPGHPVTRARDVRPEQLHRYPFVFREEGSGTRAAAERALEQVGLTGLPVATVLGSGEAVKRAVAAGVGLAFISACSLTDADAARLVVVPVRGLALHRQLYVALDRERPPGRLAAALRDWLLAPEAQALLAAQPHVRPAAALATS
ncbi:MAG TPA: LysR family transcriptional regulator [Chloroflexota bacterium]|nr:LysR family transcriptional regulator [Chloroflexota bacterium]